MLLILAARAYDLWTSAAASFVPPTPFLIVLHVPSVLVKFATWVSNAGARIKPAGQSVGSCILDHVCDMFLSTYRHR
jgi:hypothetical protein